MFNSETEIENLTNLALSADENVTVAGNILFSECTVTHCDGRATVTSVPVVGFGPQLTICNLDRDEIWGALAKMTAF